MTRLLPSALLVALSLSSCDTGDAPATAAAPATSFSVTEDNSYTVRHPLATEFDLYYTLNTEGATDKDYAVTWLGGQPAETPEVVFSHVYQPAIDDYEVYVSWPGVASEVAQLCVYTGPAMGEGELGCQEITQSDTSRPNGAARIEDGPNSVHVRKGVRAVDFPPGPDDRLPSVRFPAGGGGLAVRYENVKFMELRFEQYPRALSKGTRVSWGEGAVFEVVSQSSS